MIEVLTVEETVDGDALAEAAEKAWGWYLVAGILTVLFGFVVLSFRFGTILALAVFAGIFFIGIGVVQIVGAFRGMKFRWSYLIVGLLSIAAGVVSLAWPDVTLFVLAILIGWTLLFWGIADVVYSLTFHRQMHYWWLYLIRGLVSIGLGVWALAQPKTTLVVLVTVIGIWAVFWGVLEIVAAFFMRHARKRWESYKASVAAG
jgi:uncharacterized membrane protein HdeD (DUF308 family)